MIKVPSLDGIFYNRRVKDYIADAGAYDTMASSFYSALYMTANYLSITLHICS